MKLLLDEMYVPEIATQLRKKGHDVAAVSASAHAGLSDPEVLAPAVRERRALVTNKVRDFMPIHGALMRAGGSHFGIVFTDDRSMPRGRGAVGRFTKVLGRFLDERPAADALMDGVAWIP